MDAASVLEEILERVDRRKEHGDQNRREKYIYLITLLPMGLKQREYAEKMTERFGYCSQVTIYGGTVCLGKNGPIYRENSAV